MTADQAQPRRPAAHVPLGVVAILILINVLWAASAAAAKIAMGGSAGQPPTGIGPFTLALFRFAPASALLWAMARVRGEQLSMRREDRLSFVLVGLTGITLAYAVFYTGVRLTTATETTLLIAGEPVLLTLMAWALLHERIGRRRQAGLALGFAGVYLVIVRGLVPAGGGNVLGNAVVALSLCFECYSGIIGKRLTQSYPGLMVGSIQMATGSALLVPFAAVELASHPHLHPTAAAIGGVVYLSVFCSAICYGAWYVVMERHPLSSMAPFLFIQPVMAPVFGYWLQGERLHLWTAIGAAFVMAGVWLVAASAPGAARQEARKDHG
jgi:drug/metabolite transporter (DMT)-like permease